MDEELAYFTSLKNSGSEETTSLQVRLFPNPVRSTASFSYHLHEEADVTLRIYNVLGQVVTTLVNRKQHRGTKMVHWNGLDDQQRTVAKGLYIYQLRINGQPRYAKFLKF